MDLKCTLIQDTSLPQPNPNASASPRNFKDNFHAIECISIIWSNVLKCLFEVRPWNNHGNVNLTIKQFSKAAKIKIYRLEIPNLSENTGKIEPKA